MDTKIVQLSLDKYFLNKNKNERMNYINTINYYNMIKKLPEDVVRYIDEFAPNPNDGFFNESVDELMIRHCLFKASPYCEIGLFMRYNKQEIRTEYNKVSPIIYNEVKQLLQILPYIFKRLKTKSKRINRTDISFLNDIIKTKSLKEINPYISIKSVDLSIVATALILLGYNFDYHYTVFLAELENAHYKIGYYKRYVCNNYFKDVNQLMIRPDTNTDENIRCQDFVREKMDKYFV